MGILADVRKHAVLSAVGAVVAIIVGALVAPIRRFFGAILGALWFGLVTASGGVAHWLTEPITSSHAQRVLWFVLGFAACGVLYLVGTVRRLAGSGTLNAVDAEEGLVLQYMVLRGGHIVDLDDAARATGLSKVRVNQLCDQLVKAKLAKSSLYGWYLTARGRQFVMSKGWA